MVAALIITECSLVTIRNEAQISQLKVLSFVQYRSERRRGFSSRCCFFVTQICGAVLLFFFNLIDMALMLQMERAECGEAAQQ